MVVVSFAEARAVVASAAAVNLEARTPFPEGAEAAMRTLEIQPKGAAPLQLDPPAPDDERHYPRGHFLHDEPELAPWLPTEKAMRLLADRVDALATSKLELTPAQKVEGVREKVHALAREQFIPEVARRYALRLWKMGDFFERTRRADAAALARAEAKRLFHGQVAGSRFVEFLFEKVLILTAQARGGKLPERGERLTSEEMVPQAEKRSPAGLILP
jgi:hypothetical protein